MDRPWYKSFDFVLVGVCVALSLSGILFIHSATLHDAAAAAEYRKQAAYFLVGLGVMGVFAYLDYRLWKRWWMTFYVLNLLLLGLVMVKGNSALGAQRWLAIGPFQFQPAEPAKLAIAMTVAGLLAKGSFTKLTDLIEPLIVVMIPALLILKQPDLGTTLVIVAILSTELFFGLPRLKHFAVYATTLLIAGIGVVKFALQPFQRARLFIFLNPKADPQGAGWNLSQSKIAVGSGELFGKGLFHGTQTQLNFVPEHSRDFIFTVIGEETGFVGACLLLLAYGAILYCGLRAVLEARDRFGFLLAVGIVAMLGFHVMVNIGMTIGIMPITGIPLPFMSYGGTAIITNFAAIGILLNIRMQRDRLVF